MRSTCNPHRLPYLHPGSAHPTDFTGLSGHHGKAIRITCAAWYLVLSLLAEPSSFCRKWREIRDLGDISNKRSATAFEASKEHHGKIATDFRHERSCTNIDYKSCQLFVTLSTSPGFSSAFDASPPIGHRAAVATPRSGIIHAPSVRLYRVHLGERRTPRQRSSEALFSLA
ncbi:hypothetical protein E1B28_012941 [Marasmius oreades]|uniref:Uncharacterized protein n=1 Tax=Marasmius oreades TaxID=181124 RepID=A0A9P7RSQ8_9AGAR|nr:uncharacterized protein E1B28_012941 [Marasmius oreades]KAG7088995.1 hypothetical protein E1B28_012941 [Marasmius oreades]